MYTGKHHVGYPNLERVYLPHFYHTHTHALFSVYVCAHNGMHFYKNTQTLLISPDIQAAVTHPPLVPHTLPSNSYRVCSSWIHSVSLSARTDGPVSVVQLRRLAPQIQSDVDFRDGSCPRTVSRSRAQTGAAPGSSALTGGAQQALNAAINLHHGGV